MPILGGPNLSCNVANKNKTTPESTRALAKRPGSIQGARTPAGQKKQPSQSLCLEVVRGHKPPGHPPTPCLGVSTRQLPAGDGLGHTRQGTGWGGPGGLRVGRPCFPILAYTERDARRKRQQARKEAKKRTPTHPRTTGKTPGKHGKGNPPTQREEAPGGKGEGKRGKGNPTNPERNRKAPLDAKRKSQKHDKIAWGKHLDDRAELEEVRAQHGQQKAQASRRRKKTKITKTQLINPVVSQSS